MGGPRESPWGPKRAQGVSWTLREKGKGGVKVSRPYPSGGGAKGIPMGPQRAPRDPLGPKGEWKEEEMIEKDGEEAEAESESGDIERKGK